MLKSLTEIILYNRFCIDIGKNEMKINVQPMEGLIKLNKEITLGVQVTGRKEGIFRGEFW